MNTVFALDQSFSRTNTLKSRCQSSSLNTETKKIQKTFRATMADRCRSCSPRGVHALPTPPRRASALQKKASACPTRSPAPFTFPSSPPRAAASATAAMELRHHLAHAPPQEHVAQFALSLTVFLSTSSTSPSCQFGLGKGQIAVSSTAAMAGPHRNWCSTQPTATVAFPSSLSHALAAACATDARRAGH